MSGQDAKRGALLGNTFLRGMVIQAWRSGEEIDILFLARFWNQLLDFCLAEDGFLVRSDEGDRLLSLAVVEKAHQEAFLISRSSGREGFVGVEQIQCRGGDPYDLWSRMRVEYDVPREAT